MNLDLELKRALRRQAAPPGFAARVAQRIERQTPARPVAAWRAVAAAGLMTALLGGWALRAAAVQRAAGERARQEVLLALGITGEKLRDAQARVRDIGSPRH